MDRGREPGRRGTGSGSGEGGHEGGSPGEGGERELRRREAGDEGGIGFVHPGFVRLSPFALYCGSIRPTIF